MLKLYSENRTSGGCNIRGVQIPTHIVPPESEDWTDHLIALRQERLAAYVLKLDQSLNWVVDEMHVTETGYYTATLWSRRTGSRQRIYHVVCDWSQKLPEVAQ